MINLNEFKEIPNTGGEYLINTNGVVFSRKTNKIIYGSSTGRYIQVKINGSPKLLHRLVMMTHNPIRNYSIFCVNHKDKNTCNNSVENLEWATQKQNVYWNKIVPQLSFHPFHKRESQVIDLSGEIWAKVKGHSQYYVSNIGRVKIINDNGHWLMSCKPRKDGYVRVCLVCKRKKKSYYLHRLVAGAFIPNKHTKPLINHLDGNKSNNCVGNLEWVTRKENAEHAIKVLGVQPMGESHYMTKLTKSDIVDIMALRKNGKKLREISLSYGVSLSTIGKITTGVNWKQAV